MSELGSNARMNLENNLLFKISNSESSIKSVFSHNAEHTTS